MDTACTRIRDTRSLFAGPTLFAVLVCTALTICTSVTAAAAQQTCCRRFVGTKPTLMPAGQDTDIRGFIQCSVDSWLMKQTRDSTCPKVEFYDIEAMAERDKLEKAISDALRRQKHWLPLKPANVPVECGLDYVFEPKLKADVITGKSKRVCEEGYEPGTEDCWGGNLLGTFTFTLELRDHHHGETLRRGSKSWSGSILEGLGFWRARGDEPISNLVKAMFPPGDPLDKVIRDYERIPETCKVRWTRDQLQAGEVQTIYLENAVDAEGRPTRWWQRVIVGVDKGKILNGEQYEGLDLWVFQVGKDGRVEVEYQAPPECRNTSVTLTVFNTCDKHENEKCGESLKKYYPEKEIARKVFEVVCDQWALEVTYREDLTTNRRGPLGDNLFVDHAGRNLVWSAKAILKPLRDPRSARGRSELEAVEQTRKSLEADDAEQSQKLAEVERRLRKRLDERARRAAQHPVYFATSADIKLKDSFNRIYRWFFRDRQAGEMKVAEWQVSWNSDWKGSVPLTPELVLNAEKGWYRLRLSAHRDGIEKPAKFFVPFEFDYRSWNVSTRVLQCTGTADVLHPVPDLDIPDDLLIYDGKQRELRGERTWNDVLSGLAPIAEPPGCGGKNPFSEGISIGSLPDLPRAFKKTVTWTLRKLED